MQLFVQNKQTFTIWLVMVTRSLHIESVSQMDILIPAHKIVATIGALSLSPRGIESPSRHTIPLPRSLDEVDCKNQHSISLGSIEHRVDYFGIVSVCCHGWGGYQRQASPDGRTNVVLLPVVVVIVCSTWGCNSGSITSGSNSGSSTRIVAMVVEVAPVRDRIAPNTCCPLPHPSFEAIRKEITAEVEI